MKFGYRALIAMLSINLASYLVSGAGLFSASQPLTGMNLTQVGESLNATGIVEAWDWGGGTVLGDVVSALRFFWNLFRYIILGFPTLLSSMGIPDQLVNALNILWSAYWVIFVVWMIGGRDIEGP